MKHCPACSAQFDALLRSCPSCGASPAMVDGFDAYAPELAREGAGFKASYFAELAPLEASNFWFRARNEIIVWATRQYAPHFNSFLEVGCGTGFVLAGLAEHFPDARLEGSEVFVEGLAFASQRLPSVRFTQMDARQIPFVGEYDAIGAFDVLEHIKEDETVLRQMHKALKPGGTLLVSVPQHPWLWSAMDVHACHERRYTASDLHRKVRAAGFEVLRSTSFVSVLLPAMLASRFLKKADTGESFDANAELRIAPSLNALFFRLLKAELAFIRRGVDFPMGGSRLVVARKV